MRRVVAFFIDNPIYSNTLIVFAALFGFIAATNLNKESFPETNPDVVTVNVAFPGASPLEVEEGILMPVEEAVDAIQGIDKITSNAFENFGSVRVEIQHGYDADVAFRDMRDAVEQVNTFPDGIERPRTNLQTKRRLVTSIIIYGNQDYVILKEKAEEIRDGLLSIDGISQVSLTGVPSRTININMDQDALRRFNLTMRDVSDKIRQHNLNISAGRLKTENYEFRLRLYGRAYWARDLEKIIVKNNENGSKIRLKDIAEIKESWDEDPNWLQFGKDSQNAVSLDITKTQEEDILEIRNKAFDYIEKIRPTLPETIKINNWRDGTKSLSDRIELLTKNGIFGLILILICLGVFLNVKLAFWVAMGLPFAFLASFIIIIFTPVTINLVSLFGMILVSGILVDDAIVIGENIFEKREEGMSARDAAIEGTMQVLPAVFVSILTTVIAFIPFFFIVGGFGKFIWHMAAIVITCLLLSLVESVLILPAHLKHALENNSNSKPKFKFRLFINKILDYVMFSLIFRPIKRTLDYPVICLVAGVCLLVFTFGLMKGGHLQFSFFPKIDSDFIIAEVEMEPGTSLKTTKEVLARIRQAAFDLDEKYESVLGGKSLVQKVWMTTGGSGGKQSSEYGRVALQLMKGEERKDVKINLRGKDGIERKTVLTAYAFMGAWRQQTGKIAGVRNVSFERYGGHPFGPDITIQLTGRNIDQLKMATNMVKDALGNEKGTYDLQVLRYSGKDEIVFDLTDKGKALGLTRMDIARQVREAFYGIEVLELQRGRDSVELWLRYDDESRSKFEDINEIYIITPNGSSVPIEEVANYKIKPGIAKIVRENRRRLMEIISSVDETTANAGEIQARLKEGFFPEIESTFPGIKVQLAGQKIERAKTSNSMKRAFPLALLFMLIMVALLFRSYIQSFMVLSMIPFGFVGAAIGHVIIDIDWTILSVIGMIGLSGIVVNDSVVLVDAINRFRKNGYSIHDACLNGAKSRIRPILLTSITTFASLLPLLSEKSFQAQFLIPIGVTISFGLLSVTVYALFFMPCYYLLVESTRAKFKEIYAKPNAELEKQESQVAMRDSQP